MKLKTLQSQILISAFLFLPMVLGLVSCGKAPEPSPFASFTDAKKLYKINYFIAWKAGVNGRIFTVTPPDATGALSVTPYVDPGPGPFDLEKFKAMVMKDFVECRVKTPFKPIQSPLWTGEQAEYEGWNQGARIDWVFRVTYKGNVGVFLAVNEMRIHMKDRLPTYKAMMDSLVILTAEPTPVAVLKPIITPEPTKTWMRKIGDFLQNKK